MNFYNTLKFTTSWNWRKISLNPLWSNRTFSVRAHLKSWQKSVMRENTFFRKISTTIKKWEESSEKDLTTSLTSISRKLQREEDNKWMISHKYWNKQIKLKISLKWKNLRSSLIRHRFSKRKKVKIKGSQSF